MSTLIRATGGRAEIEPRPATAAPGTRATAAAARTEAAFGMRTGTASRVEIAFGMRASAATRMEAALGMRAVSAGTAFRMGTTPTGRTSSRVGTGPGKRKPATASPSRGPAGAGSSPGLTAVTAWIGAGPGLNEPAGFAVDLDRVLTVLPRRNVVPPPVSGPTPNSRRSRGRGRWSGVPFAGMGWPNVARIWSRGKGWRR